MPKDPTLEAAEELKRAHTARHVYALELADLIELLLPFTDVQVAIQKRAGQGDLVEIMAAAAEYRTAVKLHEAASRELLRIASQDRAEGLPFS